MSETFATRALDPGEWDRPEWLTARERHECAGPRRREKVAARAGAKSLLLDVLDLNVKTADPTHIEWAADDRGRPAPQFDDHLAGVLDDEARSVSVSWSHTGELVTVMIARLSRH